MFLNVINSHGFKCSIADVQCDFDDLAPRVAITASVICRSEMKAGSGRGDRSSFARETLSDSVPDPAAELPRSFDIWWKRRLSDFVNQ